MAHPVRSESDGGEAMTDEDLARLFAACGCTCDGGASNRTCDCRSPWRCKMREHPEFQARRDAVDARRFPVVK